MQDEHDRSRIEVDRADRVLIWQAAARLREGAIRTGPSSPPWRSASSGRPG